MKTVFVFVAFLSFDGIIHQICKPFDIGDGLMATSPFDLSEFPELNDQMIYSAIETRKIITSDSFRTIVVRTDIEIKMVDDYAKMLFDDMKSRMAEVTDQIGKLRVENIRNKTIDLLVWPSNSNIKVYRNLEIFWTSKDTFRLRHDLTGLNCCLPPLFNVGYENLVIGLDDADEDGIYCATCYSFSNNELDYRSAIKVMYDNFVKKNDDAMEWLKKARTSVETAYNKANRNENMHC